MVMITGTETVTDMDTYMDEDIGTEIATDKVLYEYGHWEWTWAKEFHESIYCHGITFVAAF
jgi:hypothetical protein